MHGLTALLVLGSLAFTADTDAKCAMVGIVAKPLTAANTTIGPGGGVVVGLTHDGRYGGRPTVEQKGWRFKQGGKLTEPTIKILAPSLAVYEFTGNSATLVDDKQKPLVTVRRGKEPAALTAPTVRTATAEVDDDSTARRWSAGARLTVELAAAPPAGVLGVIVYVDKVPQNWAVVDPKFLAVSFDAGGHCANDLPDTLLPTTGKITVAWFDGTGRVSAPSAAIAIKKTTR